MKQKVKISTPHGEGVIENIWVSELGYLMVKVFYEDEKVYRSFNLSTHDPSNNIFTNAICTSQQPKH